MAPIWTEEAIRTGEEAPFVRAILGRTLKQKPKSSPEKSRRSRSPNPRKTCGLTTASPLLLGRAGTCRIVEHTVRVDGGLIGWWWVIRLVDIWVLVSCVGRRRVVEVESPTFPIIRKMEWGEACAEPVWTIIKTRDPPAKVEVVHWAVEREKQAEVCHLRQAAWFLSPLPKVGPTISSTTHTCSRLPTCWPHLTYHTRTLNLNLSPSRPLYQCPPSNP